MSREAATAKALLTKFGEPVTLTKPGTPSFDPVTGEPVVGSGGTAYTGKGYAGRYVTTDVDGTNIQQSDIRLVLELLPERPDRGWMAAVDGKAYRVMDVRAIRKAGEDVITICQLRAS